MREILNRLKEKIKGLIAKINEKIDPYKKNIIYPLLKILCIIILCAIIAHIMGGGETLLEYEANR